MGNRSATLRAVVDVPAQLRGHIRRLRTLQARGSSTRQKLSDAQIWSEAGPVAGAGGARPPDAEGRRA
jgi:hypothetical protein